MENKRKTIALVDDNITYLQLCKQTLIQRYDVFTVPSFQKLELLLTKVRPDLILLDVEMPGMNGYDVIRRLKSREDTAGIPVIFLTAMNNPEYEMKGLNLGAVDYIFKPFSPPLLVKRIELHLLVEEQKRELENYNVNLEWMIREKTDAVFHLQNTILKTVAELVEYRDDITGGHIERTQVFLKILVDNMVGQGVYKDVLDGWDLGLFVMSAQLHDVGKIAIKDRILLKPGRLTNEEFNEMKKHTTYGMRIIQSIENNTSQSDFLKHAEILAGNHHEKWNGGGYPQGLAGDDIPLQGRLMAIVDVYDALTNERPYKKAVSHEAAAGIIEQDSGSHFDPALVEIFLACQDEFRQITDCTGQSADWKS